MKNIALTRYIPFLENFLNPDTLFAFDFDGTLAPIAKRPGQAKLSARTRKVLDKLCRHFPVTVVTGRGLDDIREKFTGVKVHSLVGNHGAEWTPQTRSYKKQIDQVRAWGESLRESLSDVRGVIVENKIYSLSVHFRNTPDPEEAARRIAVDLKKLQVGRVIKGKDVFNVLSVGMPHKGAAVKKLLTQFKCRRAIFFGDDVTDEDVFLLKNPKILGIHVGTARKTSATYYLDDQDQMDDFIMHLIRVFESKQKKRATP